MAEKHLYIPSISGDAKVKVSYQIDPTLPIPHTKLEELYTGMDYIDHAITLKDNTVIAILNKDGKWHVAKKHERELEAIAFKLMQMLYLEAQKKAAEISTKH